ncbi:hypothetical protein Tco_0407181 [Tanacetum coccineum]
MMSFLSAVVTSRYPNTNNHLRNLSNPRQQATINDGRVILQPVQGRQISVAVGTIRTYTPAASRSNSRKQRTVICYNYKGEGHMSKQCTKPKRKWDDLWFKDKVLLIQELQKVKPHRLSLPTMPMIWMHMTLIVTKIALMANLSHYGSNALAKVNNHDNMDNNLINQAEQAMPSSEQSSVAAVQNSKSSAQQDALILSVIEQLKTHSVEIDRLKQTISEHLKEKESLMQTDTLLKNDFKKEESRNIDREIALEKKIKQLDNIVYKRDQSAQTKAQQLEPNLYDGNVIKNTSAIVIPDTEETLMLVEESHPSPSCRPTKVEVPKELPKVSMVTTSLKKLKHYLAGFGVLVKERTTATTITEGSWGFEHTKACFRDEIIPFVKALKDISNTFDQYLIDELTDVQNSQEKDTVIRKLKERIKSLSGNMNEDKVKKDIEEIETLNIESDHKEKVFVITTLKNELRKLKGKDLADNGVTKDTNAPEMLKINVEPIAPRLLNNRTTHSYYLKHTQEQAAILRDEVEQGRSQNLLNNSLDSALENACPLTRITTTTEVPLRKPTVLKSDTPKPVVTLVYLRKPKKSKTNVPVRQPKIIKSISANNKEPSKSWGSIVSDIPSSSLDECRNDHVAKILGYSDYQIGNVMISRVYYIKGLRHNLFSVGQFYDSNLEVDFHQHTCFIRNLEGVDLLTGFQGNNLYTLSLGDMMTSSPICLLSKASKTKSWLWHRHLSHLNFVLLITGSVKVPARKCYSSYLFIVPTGSVVVPTGSVVTTGSVIVPARHVYTSA